jgi:hypothetical protein
MFLRRLASILSFSFLLMGRSDAQEARIERARQFQALETVPDNVPAATIETIDLGTADDGRDSESFGVQQLLKEQERLRYWRIAPELSAFATNNVGLTRTAEKRDSFLLAILPVEYRRPLGRRWALMGDLRFSVFRYNRFSVLDFNSLDVGAGMNYHSDWLGGSDWFARYNFNALFAANNGDTFFKNHTILLGVQKAFPFSQAHYAYVGLTGQLGFADPSISQRSEVVAFAGYHLQATRNLEVDLLYRTAGYFYSEIDRREWNQTISLGVRYRFNERFSGFASSYAVWNRSSAPVFDYDAANAGGGLTFAFDF